MYSYMLTRIGHMVAQTVSQTQKKRLFPRRRRWRRAIKMPAAEFGAELEAALAATLDIAAKTRQFAEARLESLEAQPYALAALLQLATLGGGARDEGTRLAAAIRVKHLTCLRPTSELEQFAPHLLQAAIRTPHCGSLADALRLLSQLHSGSALALASALRPQIEAPDGAAASIAVRALEMTLRGAAMRDDSPGAAVAPVAQWAVGALLSSASALLPPAIAGDAAASAALRLHFKCIHRLWVALGDEVAQDTAVLLPPWIELGVRTLREMSNPVQQRMLGSSSAHGPCDEHSHEEEQKEEQEEADLRAMWGVQRRVLKWICALLHAPGFVGPFAVSARVDTSSGLVRLLLPSLAGVGSLPPRLAGAQATSLALEAVRRLARDGHVATPEACLEILQGVIMPQVRFRERSDGPSPLSQHTSAVISLELIRMEPRPCPTPPRISAGSAPLGRVALAR
jgi:hypothetical protein